MAERIISVEILDDITECPVCTESYTDPRSLPCVHTFCLKCITQWSRDKFSGDNVDCPLCRRSFKIPKEGIDKLPKNIFVAKLLAMKEAPGDISTKPCDPCSASPTTPSEKTSKAVAFCVDCHENLCEICRDVHANMKMSRSHRTVAAKEQFNIPTTCLPTACDKHPNKDLELYCLDCQEALCIVCFVTQHNGHRSDEIAKVVSSFRQDINKNISELQQTSLPAISRALRNVQDKRRKCVQTFSDVENEVCARAEQLKATIERHKQQLLTELKELKTGKLKEIDNTISEITQNKTLLESFVKYSEELLKKGSDGDIARESRNLKLTSTEMKQLCGKDREKFLSEAAVNFEPSKHLSLHDKSENFVGTLSGNELSNTSRRNLSTRQLQIKQPSKTGPAKANKADGLKTAQKKLCPTLKFSQNDNNYVTAVCSLNSQLFVIRPLTKEINVYDASTFTIQRRISASVSSGFLCGLAACATNNCLYVSDNGQNAVYKMNLAATDLKSATKWPVASSPLGLSVNSSHNLLVASGEERKIQEFSTNGSLIREISDGNKLCHAIELSRGTIVVSQSGPVHGVSVKSVDGRGIKTYGSTTTGSGPGRMNEPRCLAVDSKGFVIVADKLNNRILVLNPELTEARPLPLPRDVELKWPCNLCYEESLGHLYVSEIRRLLVFGNVFDVSSLFSH